MTARFPSWPLDDLPSHGERHRRETRAPGFGSASMQPRGQGISQVVLPAAFGLRGIDMPANPSDPTRREVLLVGAVAGIGVATGLPGLALANSKETNRM